MKKNTNPLECVRPLLASPMPDDAVGRILRRVAGVIPNPLTDQTEESFASQMLCLLTPAAKDPKKVAAGQARSGETMEEVEC